MKKRESFSSSKKKLFLKSFQRLVIKNRNSHVHCCTSHKIIALTDKMCGNESKIAMIGQNYRFFKCIFPIFQILIKFEGE